MSFPNFDELINFDGFYYVKELYNLLIRTSKATCKRDPMLCILMAISPCGLDYFDDNRIVRVCIELHGIGFFEVYYDIDNRTPIRITYLKPIHR